MIKALFIVMMSFVASQNYAIDRFEVSHAQTSVVDGRYYLSADIGYRLHDEALEVLERGLPVRFELQVELFLQRRYWRNKTILNKQKTYTLQRNILTERFVLSVPDDGTSQTFANAQDAIASLRYLEDIFLIEENLIGDAKKVQARARLVVDVRHFPDPLQYLAKYWDDWHLVSEWYVWPLKL